MEQKYNWEKSNETFKFWLLEKTYNKNQWNVVWKTKEDVDYMLAFDYFDRIFDKFNLDLNSLEGNFDINSLFKWFKEHFENTFLNLNIDKMTHHKVHNCSNDEMVKHFWFDILNKERLSEKLNDSNIHDFYDQNDNYFNIIHDDSKVVHSTIKININWNDKDFVILKISWKEWWNTEIDFTALEKLWKNVHSDSISMLTKLITEKYLDNLTWLYNINVPYELIKKNHNYSMLFVDIASFKIINDKLGQSIWDEVIKYFWKKLKWITRGNEYAIRIGWDEFIILCENWNSIEETGKWMEIIEKRFKDSLKEHFISEWGKELPIQFTSWYSISTSECHKDFKVLIDESNYMMSRNKWDDWKIYRFLSSYLEVNDEIQTKVLYSILWQEFWGVFDINKEQMNENLMNALGKISNERLNEIIEMINQLKLNNSTN